MARSAQDMLFDVADEAAWTQLVADSDNFCIVVDCYQSWCGPCETMQAIYQQIFLAYDRCPERAKFATLEIDKFKEQLKAAIPEDAHVKLDSHGCMPLFLIVRSRQVVGVVKGVNSPSLLQHVALNMPPVPSDEDM